MKVLFVESPLSYRHPKIFPRHPPHYAAYAAALLEKHGHATAILDAFHERLSEDEVVKRTVAERPDVVVFIPFDYTRETPMEISHRLAERVREAAPHVVLGLAGGMYESFFRTALEECAAFKFAVVGEYEIPLLEMAQAVGQGKPWAAVSGLLVRNGNGIASTGPGRLVENLDELPFPAWHRIDLMRYTFIPHRFRYAPFYPLLASRGCPFACITCKEARVAKITRFRIRSVPNVMAEIRMAIERYGAKEIQFSDANFGMERQWVFELCEAMERGGLRIPWSAISRVDVLDAAMLARMSRAGCWNVLYGIESGNQQTLERIRKGISLEQVISTVRATQEAGITTTGSYILGLPGETRADILRTIEFARELDTDYAQFCLLKYIGQARDLLTWGRLTEEWDYPRYDFRGPVFLPSAIRDLDELKAFQKLAYRRFYFRWSFIRRKLPELFVPGQFLRLTTGAWIAAKLAFKL